MATEAVTHICFFPILKPAQFLSRFGGARLWHIFVADISSDQWDPEHLTGPPSLGSAGSLHAGKLLQVVGFGWGLDPHRLRKRTGSAEEVLVLPQVLQHCAALSWCSTFTADSTEPQREPRRGFQQHSRRCHGQRAYRTTANTVLGTLAHRHPIK